MFFGAIGAQEDSDLIRVKTELVPFEVMISDAHGNPVRGLKESDFRIFDEGVEQEIAYFEPVKRKDSSRPLSIVFGVDVSGSITGDEFERLRAAVGAFGEKLSDYDVRFSVVSFGMTVSKVQSFTGKISKLQKAFSRMGRDDEGLSTHTYDAIDFAIRMLRKNPATEDFRPKRVVILITDGFPVGDIVSPETVIERANQARTTVYSVILPSYSRLQSSKSPVMTLLEASGVSKRTGGRVFYANSDGFESLFESLAEELTASYVLAYYPKERREGQEFRRVRIETRPGLVVRQNRAGYRLDEERADSQ